MDINPQSMSSSEIKMFSVHEPGPHITGFHILAMCSSKMDSNFRWYFHALEGRKSGRILAVSIRHDVALELYP